MGGRASEEFMVETQSGEDTCAVCPACGYSANIEIAKSMVKYNFGSGGKTPCEVHTPDRKTIEEVSSFLKQKPEKFLKALLYIVDKRPVMVLISGADELNENKLAAKYGKQVRPAHPEEVLQYMGVLAGFIGPVGLKHDIQLLADETLRGAREMVCGANKEDYHIVGLDLGVHCREPEYDDFRIVRGKDACSQCGKPLRVIRALELGHIFKLGTKYSDAMKADFLDAEGKSHPIIMGSYGIGLERIVAANIEQWADEAGIRWRGEITPYKVIILPLNIEEVEAYQAAEDLYRELNNLGAEPILDDRTLRAGVKFKDADLLGIPLQVIFGKNFAEGKIELKIRFTGERKICHKADILSMVKTELKNNLYLGSKIYGVSHGN
jgi:prolyl-tRNA synthetase